MARDPSSILSISCEIIQLIWILWYHNFILRCLILMNEIDEQVDFSQVLVDVCCFEVLA